ncbi:MAG: hypothetical protein IK003_04510 [Prevotella sp.]|nr:hypothetical protein [Prevotella sp.]
MCVVIYETNVLEAGSMADKKQDEFFALTVLELASLAGVVLALRLFKFKCIHNELVTQKAPALLKWGLMRLALLELPMLSNTFFYYMFMNPAFGYMAIIQLLCLPFVYPSLNRCIAETEE